MVHLVLRKGAWAGLQPPCSTKCNSPPINGQCINVILFDEALQFPLYDKGLSEKLHRHPINTVNRCTMYVWHAHVRVNGVRMLTGWYVANSHRPSQLVSQIAVKRRLKTANSTAVVCLRYKQSSHMEVILRFSVVQRQCISVLEECTAKHWLRVRGLLRYMTALKHAASTHSIITTFTVSITVTTGNICILQNIQRQINSKVQ